MIQLAQAGLTLLFKLLSNTDTAKKVSDMIKKYTGIDINKQDLSQEDITKLKHFEMLHEEELIKLSIQQEELQLKYDDKADQNITQRIKIDSENSITRLVRPIGLISTVYTVLIIVLFHIEVDEKSLYLLGLVTLLFILMYVPARSIEKIFKIIKIFKQGAII